MTISFKEFSNILEKGQAATGGSGKFKSTAPKPSKVKAGGDKGGKLGKGLKAPISGFGKSAFGGKPKKDKPEI